MEAARKVLHEAINKYGLDSEEALEASQELDKYIVEAQKQKRLSKSEFMSKYLNDMNKKKYASKNQADCYIWDKARACGKRDAEHKKRQPYWKSK